MSASLKNLAEHSAQRKHVQVFVRLWCVCSYMSQEALIYVDALTTPAMLEMNRTGGLYL